jgi:hypothetical protein
MYFPERIYLTNQTRSITEISTKITPNKVTRKILKEKRAPGGSLLIKSNRLNTNEHQLPWG